MKFAKRLYSELVPEWEPKYIDYRGLKIVLKELGTKNTEEVADVPHPSLNATAQSALYQSIVLDDTVCMTQEESKFITHIEEQLSKVCSFYDDNEKNIVKKYLNLYDEVRIFLLDDAKKLPKEFPVSNAFTPIEANEFRLKTKFIAEESIEVLKSKREDYFRAQKTLPKEEIRRRVKTSLRKAFLEYYRLLELLKNYKILNYHGFVKIMKKFDKYRSLNCSDNFLQLLQKRNFYESTVLDTLMQNVEKLVCVVFFNGNRHMTMQKLRIASQYTSQQYSSCFRAGLLGGVSFVAMMLVFVEAWKSALKAYLIPIYAGFLALLLILWGYGFSSLLWTRFHINYKFIFQFDLRNTIRSYEYLEFVGWLNLAMSVVFLFSASSYCPQDNKTQASIFCALLGCTLVVISLPFKIFRHHTRIWFLRTMGRILTTPWHKVEYGDFFIADQITSMLPFIGSLVNIGCLFFYQGPSGQHARLEFVRNILLTCIVSFPYLIRLMQSLRRFRDGKVWYPHLVSGSKYFLNLGCFLAIGFMKTFHVNSTALVVVLYSACTLFNVFWDSFYDFGLFRFVKQGPKEKRRLIFREKNLYPNRLFYAAIFVVNIVLRLFWMWRLGLVVMSHEAVLVIAVIGEGVRRFLWNLLRIENEHLSNCGLFRAVLEIPLPYESSNSQFAHKSPVSDDGSSIATTRDSINNAISNNPLQSNQLTSQSGGLKSSFIMNSV